MSIFNYLVKLILPYNKIYLRDKFSDKKEFHIFYYKIENNNLFIMEYRNPETIFKVFSSKSQLEIWYEMKFYGDISIDDVKKFKKEIILRSKKKDESINKYRIKIKDGFLYLFNNKIFNKNYIYASFEDLKQEWEIIEKGNFTCF
jgi:hypothetical protein